MMRRTTTRLLAVPAALAALLLASCAGQKGASVPPPSPDTSAAEITRVTVTVPVENLRATANGGKVGETREGARYPLLERRANWCRIEHDSLGAVWIWAPSLGYRQVDPFSLLLWFGGREPMLADSVNAVFGAPVTVESSGGEVLLYRYPNQFENGPGTRFGTDSFTETLLWIDRRSRVVLQLEFELPPFSGTAKELLRAVGLPAARSSGTDFEKARYDNRFPGISRLELLFDDGDFDRIRYLSATRYPTGAWRSALAAGAKKIVLDGHALVLSMEVENTSGEYAFAAPVVSVNVYEDGTPAGEWTLGPAAFRLEPGANDVLEIPLPLAADHVNVNQVAATAEIVDAYAVPPSPAAQP
ncbi:MAG: hypothetical protein MAG453_00666 [Calditrichaeota bacterium]|nr:hypothetical protein [Calditrichota bacterium]